MNREQKKQHTRERLLSTADSLFSEYGYEAVSTRMIAKHCEVGVGTVFAHFSDKKALTQALFHRKIEQQLEKQEHQKEIKGGLDFFIQKSLFLYRFYEQDRAFSIALLQNSLFDLEYFKPQLDDFIAEIALHLKYELPMAEESARYVIAKAWFGYYFFHLSTGLGQAKSNSGDWLAALEADCKQLLSIII
jgi:AcrR family transcriptional regulator